jgi:hypothetical protein
MVTGLRRCLLVLPLWAGLVTACALPEDEIDSASAELATDGRWRIPTPILLFGDTQYVEYTGAGPWEGESSCQGGMTDGAEMLRDYLYAFFPQTYNIGGYACRHIVGNSSTTSVHATGRALDIMIETQPGGEADNDLGDPIAHWLILNAERIGIQFIIWDRTTWGAARPPGDKEREYGGAHPHNDHLHIELSVEAAALGADFFSEPWSAPEIDSCKPLPAEGGIIDDTDPCAQLLGPSEYWRYEEGRGYGERVAWTNAVQKEEHSNWARWQLNLSEAGRYQVEVYLPDDFSMFAHTRYEVSHGDDSSEIVIDQGRNRGWTSLGAYDFEAGVGQDIAVYDNGLDTVDDDTHISADAIRLTRIGDGDDGTPPGEGGDPDAPGESPAGLVGGCQLGGSSSGSAPIVLTLLALCWRRRRRNAAPESTRE